MQELDDSSLLRQYTEHDSEEAFAVLVERHINKVYSAALRHTRNPHQAEEITQAVFVILAKKAHNLGKKVVLSGWLYQTARLASVTFLRSEIRRSRREQEAHMQSVYDEPVMDETWWQIAPLLDEAMARLNETDRHAVVLRFFDGKSLREVGVALGASEDAAKKRVNRALEKLQRFFAKRGVSSTTAIIAGAVSANSVQAAPAALANSVTAVAFAKGVAASASTLTLVKGALKIMAWTKMKMVIVAGAAMVLAAATISLEIKREWRAHHLAPVTAVNNGDSSQQGLQGHWTGSNTAHPGQTCTLNISGNQIEYRGADSNDWLRGTFVLNVNTDPKQLDVTMLEPAKNSIIGIYEVTGDQIIIAVAPHGSTQRPADFTPRRQVDVLECKRD